MAKVVRFQEGSQRSRRIEQYEQVVYWNAQLLSKGTNSRYIGECQSGFHSHTCRIFGRQKVNKSAIYKVKQFGKSMDLLLCAECKNAIQNVGFDHMFV